MLPFAASNPESEAFLQRWDNLDSVAFPNAPDSSFVNVYVKLAYDVALAVGQGIHSLGQAQVDNLANYSESQAAATTT
jgi:hypothetical protein